MPFLHWRSLVMAFLACLWCGPATAHENLPASLMLQEVEARVFEVRWRVPQTQGAVPDVMAQLPDDCQNRASPTLQATTGARLTVWSAHCAKGLRDGAEITIAGLAATRIDAVVRVAYLDGTSQSLVARPSNPFVKLVPVRGDPLAAPGYLLLGIEHILGGIDHLLFVLCLILLVPDLWGLLKTITAFTLAHSLTLALAALGFVQMPQAPVEATIALSILFLARELARQNGTQGVALRRPWIVAFAFGLLHGFGFASALAEVGLPTDDVPLALLLFNAGVEAGQLAFIAAVYPLVLLGRRWQRPGSRWVAALPVYAVGSVAGFWWLQRMVAVVGFA